MDNQTRAIKVIVPGACPHCSKEIFISQTMVTPQISWVLKKEDLDKAKAQVLAELEKDQTIPAEEKKMMIEWVKRPDTLFGPEEIPQLLNQMINKDQNKQEDNAENN